MPPGRIAQLMAAEEARSKDSYFSNAALLILIFLAGPLIVLLVVRGKLHEVLGGRATYNPVDRWVFYRIILFNESLAFQRLAPQ